MNELLKFTIIITIVYNVAFVLVQCIHTLSNSMKRLLETIVDEKSKKPKSSGKEEKK